MYMNERSDGAVTRYTFASVHEPVRGIFYLPVGPTAENVSFEEEVKCNLLWTNTKWVVRWEPLNDIPNIVHNRHSNSVRGAQHVAVRMLPYSCTVKICTENVKNI